MSLWYKNMPKYFEKNKLTVGHIFLTFLLESLFKTFEFFNFYFLRMNIYRDYYKFNASLSHKFIIQKKVQISVYRK